MLCAVKFLCQKLKCTTNIYVEITVKTGTPLKSYILQVFAIQITMYKCRFYGKPLEISVTFIPLYTANVYRELQGLYREIGVQGFQIYGDCMYTRNPCNFEFSTLLFAL